MEKELKNCYKCLDLPYSATIEEVETREKALSKILLAKSGYEQKSEKEISKVKYSADYIVENIKKNGIPKEEFHRFDSSKESIISLLIILVFVGLICFFSFYVLL